MTGTVNPCTSGNSVWKGITIDKGLMAKAMALISHVWIVFLLLLLLSPKGTD